MLEVIIIMLYIQCKIKSKGTIFLESKEVVSFFYINKCERGKNMDKIDKMLITLLQKDARMPLKALAEKVFLSSPAVSARIERLEKEQIIEGYEVKVNQLKLGYHITAFINLEVAPAQKPEFYPFVQGCTNVVECNCVTGTYSMLLKVIFPSTMELDTFIGQLQKFGRTSTQIVFSTPVAPRGIDVNAQIPPEE